MIREVPGTEHEGVSHALPTPPALTETEQAVLALERAWWQAPGPKRDRIRQQVGLSPSAYYRCLDALIDRPEVCDADPLLVGRLRRARADRRRRRLVGPTPTRRLP